jgi:tyrosinase
VILTNISNVDRLFALWQVLNKNNDTWFDGSDSRDEDPGNYGVPMGNLDEPDDYLRPFHKSADGSYFTSTDVREVAPLGYTYPLLQKWEYLDAEGKYDNDLHVHTLAPVLNRNYNSSWDAWQRSKLTEHGEPSASISELLIAKGLGECDYHELTAQPDYVVNVVYERYSEDLSLSHL